jgi:hypothetical protein
MFWGRFRNRRFKGCGERTKIEAFPTEIAESRAGKPGLFRLPDARRSDRLGFFHNCLVGFVIDLFESTPLFAGDFAMQVFCALRGIGLQAMPKTKLAIPTILRVHLNPVSNPNNFQNCPQEQFLPRLK